MEVFEITRDLTTDECHWLSETIKKGTLVYKYHGHTYGCISHRGTAVTKEHNKLPFFEVPYNAIIEIKEKEKMNEYYPHNERRRL